MYTNTLSIIKTTSISPGVKMPGCILGCLALPFRLAFALFVWAFRALGLILAPVFGWALSALGWVVKGFGCLLLIFVAFALVIFAITGGIILFRAPAPAAPAVSSIPAVSPSLTPLAVAPAATPGSGSAVIPVPPGSTGPCYAWYTTLSGATIAFTVGAGRTDSMANSEGVLTVTCRGGSDWTSTWTPYAPAVTAVPLTAVPPTAAPAPTRTPSPTVVPTNGCVDWNWYKAQTAGIKDPGSLVTFNDSLPQKIDHPVGNWSVSGTSLVWTGWYVGSKSNAKPILVNGDMGTYVVTGGTVPTPGGEAVLCNYDGNVTQISPVYTTASDTVAEPTSCIDKATIVSIVNTWRGVNDEQIYVNLDALVDNKPGARIRSNTAAFVNGKNVQTLLWGEIGKLSGGSFVKINETRGKGLYLVSQDAQYRFDVGFSGVNICAPGLHPDPDFTWWLP